jgi:cytidylate kinase
MSAEKKYKVKDGRDLRVAISGKSGCGNTTVSSLLAEKLGIGLVNFTFRQLAAEKNLSLAEIIEKAKTDDSFDVEVDTRQVEMAKKSSCVLGSRLAVWMLKEADMKIYLFADDEIRAERILNREGGDLGEIKRFTSMRDGEDTRRYKKLYGIDNGDYNFCDMIIDTKNFTPEKIVEMIIAELKKKNLVEEISA